MIPQMPCPYGEDKCSFLGVYQPNIFNSKFLALGNLFEAIDYTGRLFGVNLQNNLESFDSLTYELCSMTYTQVSIFVKQIDISK